MNGNQWARLLAYVTGLVNQELLLQNGRSSGSTRRVLRLPPGSDGRSDVLSPRGSLVKEGELQWTGFNIAGLLCLVLMVLKLKLALLWSWWRVLLPLWVVLWQNAVHIAVGFLWLTWMGCGREGDDLRIRSHHGLDRVWAKNSILLKTRVFRRPVSVARDNVNGAM